MGIFFQRAMLSESGVRFPWWLFCLVTVSILTFVVYRGIAPSTNVMAVFGAAEVLIVTALACW
jgi:amino acid transporter